ncbi:MAG TPA: EAL domain-containing protein, partial [Chloroflexota bacterium]
YAIELQRRDANGQENYLRSTLSPIRQPGIESELVMLQIEDLTEKKQAEQDRHLQEIRARTSQGVVAALYDTSVLLSGTSTVDEAMPRVLETLGEVLNWDVVLFWEADSRGGMLQCTHLWHVPALNVAQLKSTSVQLTLPPDVGRVGQVWFTGEPAWTSRLQDDSEFLRKTSTGSERLEESIWLPVRRGDEVYAVLELLRREPAPLDASMVSALTTLGDELGRLLERKRAEQLLREREERFRSIAESAKDAVITIDDEGLMLSVNGAAEAVFGYTRAEMMGQPLTMLMPENQREPHRQGLRRYVSSGQRRLKWELIEVPGLHKNGQEILLEMSFVEFLQNGRRTFTGFLRDVTEQRHAEAALTYQALHDSLTDLPNRTLLRDRLEQAVLVARRHSLVLALLFMDLDRFKEVNDTLGHHSGDLLLQHVAARLRSALRESDTVARLGGDEFALLLPATDEAGAVQTAERALEVLVQPFILDGQSFEVSGSIGISLYPDHGDDAATLMRRADVAMYAAKRSESGYALYSPDQDEHVPGRLVLTRELRRAIESEELLLYFQPKVNLATGVTQDVEGLMRWQHPERGIMSPDGFISLAEETGLIRPLTAWALNAAMQQYRALQMLGFDIRVAVNLSARTLHDPQLVKTVSELLDTWRVDPSALELEITESAIMVHPDRAMRTLKQLHSTGVSISIDDFGTGYSSLAYLKGLPVNEIKIDRTFVMDMALNRDDASIVRSIIELGHNLGLQVVAEGVENKRTLDMLRSLGCDLAQGYFVSHPLPADQLTEWLNGLRRVAAAS